MNQLRVFVSSTCYDLSQVRADLYDFINGLGFHPVLSEYSTFPIDPDNDTIDNCIQNVETADILILIIGGRYGSVVESGKSITNTEYLYATKKGIPIYVFIYKQLVSLLPIWKLNPSANFSTVVDSIKVFDFVEQVRDKNKRWCFEFEKVQDIIPVLKIQCSHLFKSSLDLRLKFKGSELPTFYKNLSARAINLILKEGPLFEAHFFVQVLKDELDKYEDLKLDLEYKILTNCNRMIKDVRELSDWLNINVEAIQHQVTSINRLFDEAYIDFYGAPGIASDLKGLYYVACSMARIYKEMALWSINIKSTRVEPQYELVRDALSDFPQMALEQIWKYPGETISKIQEGLKILGLGSQEQIHITSVMVLTIDEKKSELFHSELGKITKSLL
jgi:hypothetical protein